MAKGPFIGMGMERYGYGKMEQRMVLTPRVRQKVSGAHPELDKLKRKTSRRKGAKKRRK